MSENTIVIIGAGLIGQQWSMLFVSSKYKVIVFDISAQQIEKAKLSIFNKLETSISENICRSKESRDTQYERIKFTSTQNELPKNAEYVMECVPEICELKTEVFAMLDTYFDKDTIRMSSSSYMPISVFTKDLINKEKCIIAHPVNPPYFLRLVEIVPAPYTDQSTVEKVTNLMEQIGQVTITLKKEIDGFALNRIQAAVYNSIFRLIKDDVVSVTDVDKILTEGLAPRWAFYGPLVISVLNGPGVEEYFSKYMSFLDSVNKSQGYPPQHDTNVRDTIVNEMKDFDVSSVNQINEKRDLYLGQVLNIKNSDKL